MEIAPPECFSWLYGEFINLYNANETVITPATIREYQELKQFHFTLYEIDLIFRMKNWANDEKQKLEKEVADVV